MIIRNLRPIMICRNRSIHSHGIFDVRSHFQFRTDGATANGLIFKLSYFNFPLLSIKWISWIFDVLLRCYQTVYSSYGIVEITASSPFSPNLTKDTVRTVPSVIIQSLPEEPVEQHRLPQKHLQAIKIERKYRYNKKLSYRWQTARRVYRSVKVIVICTIRYGMVSY